MRTLFAAIISLALAGFTSGQDVKKPLVVPGPEDVIRRILASGGYEGHDVKLIGPMGDAAAVVVTKILAGKTLLASEIDSALIVLHIAFADPGSIVVASDRKPRAAFFVLQAFDQSAQDPALKKRIIETREYLQARYESLRGPDQEP